MTDLSLILLLFARLLSGVNRVFKTIQNLSLHCLTVILVNICWFKSDKHGYSGVDQVCRIFESQNILQTETFKITLSLMLRYFPLQSAHS